MNSCKKCGAPLIPGSRFCGKCGTAVDAPVRRICPKCKSEVAAGLIFCDKCGERLAPIAVERGGKDDRPRTLTISRESQFQCLANTYRVVVDGNVIGNVSSGGALHVNVLSDITTVEIICTTIMVNARVRLRLKLGENPRVSFKVQWPGTIQPAVHNAQILELQNQY